MLAKACRGISKTLVILVLDIEERYILTEAEARGIAEPASRLLMRIKALRKPIKWITGNSDELDLLIAIGKYTVRLVDPVSQRIALAREAARMRLQMGVKPNDRPTVASNTPITPRDNRGTANTSASNGSQPGQPGIEFAGFASEPSEAGAFILPGVGIAFSQ